MAARGPKALAEYRRKRDFSKTAEPSGSEGEAGAARAPEPRKSTRKSTLRFVVQKHAASHLHFDVRLEIGGVMKSWAVPKGPSLDPAVRRLAMQVEDHPVGYNTFEGTIPAGQYGGGTVMLWDRGTYANAAGGDEAALARGYAAGRLDVVLDGERLRGGWTLVRTRGGSGKPQWLMIKRRDEHAAAGSDVVADTPTSVATGRTMEEIAGRGRPAAGGPPPKSGSRPTRAAASPRSRAAKPERATVAKAATRAATTKRAPAATKRIAPTAAATRAAAAVVEQLQEIEEGAGDGTLRIGRVALPVTNLGKRFFPADGYTKGDVMRYYAAVAPYILPAIADRPLVLRRFPNGIDGKAFYQHQVDDAPAGVRTELVTLDANEPPKRLLVGGDLPTLLHLVQLGAISVDPWHTRAGAEALADYAIIDLDPGPKAPFARVVEVARLVKAELDALGLTAALKTSGATGLHVHLPLPARTSATTALLLAQLVATRVADAAPRQATIERSVKARAAGAVYVDYLQNIPGKTVAGAYSVRARPGATVSMPLRWDELTDALDPADFTIATAPARLAAVGDLWQAAMRRRNSVRALRAIAGG